MKQFCLYAIFIFAVLMPAQSLFSQKIEYPPDFLELLQRTGLDFFEPLDAGYKDITLAQNDYQNCHFAIRSLKEGLQIRYFILPWNNEDPVTTNPHVATFRALTTLATNEDEALVSAIQPTKEMLAEDFGADWGMVYFFRPKPAFSEQPICRMVAISKEGRGTAFIFYLFNDPANEALDTRYLALRFQ